jgi:hypothetical protein
MCSFAAKGIQRSVERILGEVLLDQHREAYHPLPHVGNPAGQVDPNARRQGDHR